MGDTYDLQNRNAAVRESVGQILDYARAKIRDMCSNSRPTAEELSSLTKKLRLFIVGDDYSPAVEEVCELLRSNGINIHFIWFYN